MVAAHDGTTYQEGKDARISTGKDFAQEEVHAPTITATVYRMCFHQEYRMKVGNVKFSRLSACSRAMPNDENNLCAANYCAEHYAMIPKR